MRGGGELDVCEGVWLFCEGGLDMRGGEEFAGCGGLELD